MFMIMFSDLSVFDRRIIYSIKFDNKEIFAKNLIKTDQTIKFMNSKNIYWYIKTGRVELYKTENRKLNFKRKYNIRNSSKIQSIKINALFQNLIKRSENMIYWKKMIAYLLNMKEKLKTKFKFQRQKKRRFNEINFKKKFQFQNQHLSFFQIKTNYFFCSALQNSKSKNQSSTQKKWHNDKLILI